MEAPILSEETTNSIDLEWEVPFHNGAKIITYGYAYMDVDEGFFKEPKVFEEKEIEKTKEKPLVLTEEVKPDVAPKRDVNPTLSPAVRKIVTENNIDINSIQGSGKDGRVLKGDLISLMGANPKPSERKIQYGEEERIKMTRLRQTIAKRLNL